MSTTTLSGVRHGKRPTYLEGCRCKKCRAANAAYIRDLAHKARAAEERTRLVDAAPVARHLALLGDDGLTYHDIARRAVVPPSTVAAVLAGRARAVHRETADRLFEVIPQPRPDGDTVDASALHHQVEVLVRAGWSVTDVAIAAGVPIDLGAEQVPAPTAARVADLYASTFVAGLAAALGPLLVGASPELRRVYHRSTSTFEVLRDLFDLEPQPWRADGECRKPGVDSRWFFAEKGTPELERAREVCRRCPVADECRDQGLANGEPRGVWGELTEPERRELMRSVALASPVEATG